HEVLPAIAEADVADRSPGETAAASHEQMDVLPLRVKHLVIAELQHRPELPAPKPARCGASKAYKRNLPRKDSSNTSSFVCTSKTDRCGSVRTSFTSR